MSNIDKWCNVEDNNDEYISPINLWIEETSSGPDEPWHFFYFPVHDEDSIVDMVQDMKEVLTYAYYRFDISLFYLATKHKGKTHGNDELICCLHWLYDFT
jgi:hypothetical protein